MEVSVIGCLACLAWDYTARVYRRVTRRRSGSLLRRGHCVSACYLYAWGENHCSRGVSWVMLWDGIR